MNAPAIKIDIDGKVLTTGAPRRYRLLEWPAMLRKLDRKDPSYAQ